MAVEKRLQPEPDPDELERLAGSLLDLAAELRAQADSEIELPDLPFGEERERWWKSRSEVEVEVDPKLLKTVNTSIRLPASTIDAYTALAEQWGFRSGQTLMKAVLNNFLAKRQSGPRAWRRASKSE